MSRPPHYCRLLPRVAVALLGMSWGPALAAQAPRLLISDLSDSHIGVNSGFSGTNVLVFGAVAPTLRPSPAAPPIDIVIVLRGEARTLVVREKERVAGIWLNGRSLRFIDVPAIYQVTATDRLDQIGPAATLRQNEIGIDNLPLPVILPHDDAPPSTSKVQAFRAALVRQKVLAGVFREEDEAVTLIEGVLFRGSLHLPADVPLGRYTVSIYLLREGRVVARNILPLRIERAGLEKRISRMSERRPLLYGLFAVAFALTSGWLGTMLFRDR